MTFFSDLTKNINDFKAFIIQIIDQKMNNYVQKSSTNGLLKNDGTVDTTSYSVFGGSYNELTNKPTIPTKTSDLTNDSNFLTSNYSVDDTTIALSNNTLSVKDNGIDYKKITEYACNIGNGNAGGYACVMKLTITGSYADIPITFDVYQRKDVIQHITIGFSNTAGNDPDIYKFNYTGDENEIWAYKESSSNWYILVKRASTSDVNQSVYIRNIQTTAYAQNRITITPQNTYYAILPGSSSNRVQATNEYVKKSNTSGLIKNDGTIDTNTYLTSHQSLSNYIQKSNTSGLVKNDGTIDTTQKAATVHQHDYSDVNNTSLVSFVITYTDNSSETIQLLKYTPPNS